jgi:hypothetical protein
MTVKVTGAFLSRVERNKRLKKLRRTLQSGAFAIDTTKFIKEVQSLHAARSFRNAEGKTILQDSQRVLVNGAAENNATRGRATEIHLTCYRAKRLLLEAIESTTGYLETYYATPLANDYKTIGARKAAVKYVLEDFYKLDFRLDTVIAMVDMLVKDVDKSQWVISNTTDVLALMIAREK